MLAEYDATLGPGDLWQVSVEGSLPRHVARFRTTPSSPVVVETSDGPIVAVRADDHRDQPEDSIWTVALSGGEPVNALPDLAGNVEELMPLPGTTGRRRGANRRTDARAALRGRPPERQLDSAHAGRDCWPRQHRGGGIVFRGRRAPGGDLERCDDAGRGLARETLRVKLVP